MVLDSNFAFRSHVHDRQFAAEFAATATPVVGSEIAPSHVPFLNSLTWHAGLAMGSFLLGEKMVGFCYLSLGVALNVISFALFATRFVLEASNQSTPRSLNSWLRST